MRSQRRPQSPGLRDRCGRGPQAAVFLGSPLRSPAVHGFPGCGLGGCGACLSPLGEREQPGSRVAGISLTHDLTMLHQIADELGGCLLGDAEVHGHVGSGGITAGDAHEREAMGRRMSS